MLLPGALGRRGGQRLGVPEGTVKSRTHYALRALRLALEEMGVAHEPTSSRTSTRPTCSGALSPAERRDFERHLDGLRRVPRAVRELAGLPGLLSRLDAEEVAGLDDREPMPASLLPELLTEVRRHGRRRRLVLIATSGRLRQRGRRRAGARRRRPAHRHRGRSAGVLARSDLVLDGPARRRPADDPARAVPAGSRPPASGVAWGTRLSVTCRYLTNPPKDRGPLDYALVVRTRSGGEEQVGSWRAVPGKQITFAAATRSRPQDIVGVEVRTMSGHPLLRARL